MRVLVTGPEGQVANSLVERRPDGIDLIFVGLPDFDLSDAASIEAAVARIRPDLVVSAAAYTAVDKAEDEPALAMAVNGSGPGVLARAAMAVGAPVIHISTDYVFDGSLDRPYREDDPVGPIGVYGKTKLAGEIAVAESGADYAILRTAWVYSPFGANFVKTMLRVGADRDTLTVVADQVGCPTSALDIADAVYAVIAHWQKAGGVGDATGVFHIAGTGETSWAGFAEAVFAESAARGGPSADVVAITTDQYPTKATRPANSRLDCARFEAVFGYRMPDWRASTALVVARLVG